MIRLSQLVRCDRDQSDNFFMLAATQLNSFKSVQGLIDLAKLGELLYNELKFSYYELRRMRWPQGHYLEINLYSLKVPRESLFNPHILVRVRRTS
jgi:hypothetical protein